MATSTNRARAEQAEWFEQTEYIPFDLAELDESINYFEFFRRPDKVIHLAWEGLPNYKSSFHEEINLPRHLAFLSNLIKGGLRDLTVTGTCFEYGMQEGCLSEEMPALPANPYAQAKDRLRRELQNLQSERPFFFKHIRLFYMYGKGQSPNSLLSQLDKALASQEAVFNMSGGQQVRDYLPVKKVAEYIVKIVLQSDTTGIINCCSGIPVTVQEVVEEYLKSINRSIHLNLGYYPYADYEPMRFWGDTTKLKTILNNE